MRGASGLMVDEIVCDAGPFSSGAPRKYRLRLFATHHVGRSMTLGARMKIRGTITSKLAVPLLVVGGITTACWAALLVWGVGTLLAPFIIDALTLAAAVAGE